MATAGEFNGLGHLIGCSEWARLWEAHWGRANLDATSIANLEAMKRRGRGDCCIHDSYSRKAPDGALESDGLDGIDDNEEE